MEGSGPRERVWLLRGAVIAVAVIAALVAWAARDGEEVPGDQVKSEPRVVSEGELVEVAAALGQPVYWAGPVEGTELELEEVEEGGVRVRYIPADEAGEAPPDVLTIGSYPLDDPVGALKSFGSRPGAIVRQAEDGLEVFSSREAPTSVYFADSEGGVQVEIYDPSAEEAMSLALSGDVEPVE